MILSSKDSPTFLQLSQLQSLANLECPHPALCQGVLARKTKVAPSIVRTSDTKHLVPQFLGTHLVTSGNSLQSSLSISLREDDLAPFLG